MGYQVEHATNGLRQYRIENEYIVPQNNDIVGSHCNSIPHGIARYQNIEHETYATGGESANHVEGSYPSINFSPIYEHEFGEKNPKSRSMFNARNNHHPVCAFSDDQQMFDRRNYMNNNEENSEMDMNANAWRMENCNSSSPRHEYHNAVYGPGPPNNADPLYHTQNMNFMHQLMSKEYQYSQDNITRSHDNNSNSNNNIHDTYSNYSNTRADYLQSLNNAELQKAENNSQQDQISESCSNQNQNSQSSYYRNKNMDSNYLQNIDPDTVQQSNVCSLNELSQKNHSENSLSAYRTPETGSLHNVDLIRGSPNHISDVRSRGQNIDTNSHNEQTDLGSLSTELPNSDSLKLVTDEVFDAVDGTVSSMMPKTVSDVSTQYQQNVPDISDRHSLYNLDDVLKPSQDNNCIDSETHAKNCTKNKKNNKDHEKNKMHNKVSAEQIETSGHKCRKSSHASKHSLDEHKVRRGSTDTELCSSSHSKKKCRKSCSILESLKASKFTLRSHEKDQKKSRKNSVTSSDDVNSVVIDSNESSPSRNLADVTSSKVLHYPVVSHYNQLNRVSSTECINSETSAEYKYTKLKSPGLPNDQVLLNFNPNYMNPHGPYHSPYPFMHPQSQSFEALANNQAQAHLYHQMRHMAALSQPNLTAMTAGSNTNIGPLPTQISQPSNYSGYGVYNNGFMCNIPPPPNVQYASAEQMAYHQRNQFMMASVPRGFVSPLPTHIPPPGYHQPYVSHAPNLLLESASSCSDRRSPASSLCSSASAVLHDQNKRSNSLRRHDKTSRGKENSQHYHRHGKSSRQPFVHRGINDMCVITPPQTPQRDTLDGASVDSISHHTHSRNKRHHHHK